MSTSKKRQLAAILFADIVGYTALMQKDETTAFQIVEKFRSTLLEKVPQFIILFPSTVNAIQCAYEMQVAFQDTPKVPLRIGIHIGEIIRKGTKTNPHEKIHTIYYRSPMVYALIQSNYFY